jgi:2-keto-3-deoxy-6-phosphogluconate aldolase
VTVETCASFFHVGCVAVAAGSSLLSENLLVSRDWKRVTERTRTFVAVAKKAKM